MRAIWSGHITFGLISIPVGLHAAVEASERVSFRLLHKKDMAPIIRSDDYAIGRIVSAYKQLGRFEERTNFGTWLHRIAVNCALDLLRSRGRLDRHYGGDPEEAEMMGAIRSSDPQQDRLLLSAELRDQVTAAMEKLSGNERTAFVLRHFEGMPVEEIGKTLGIQVNAAKHTIFRAVRKLRGGSGAERRSRLCPTPALCGRCPARGCGLSRNRPVTSLLCLCAA